jgi:hypothetical protein
LLRCLWAALYMIFKSHHFFLKEILDYCVYKNVEPERERLIGHSIQTWRMFHRQESKPGFWFVFKIKKKSFPICKNYFSRCDICKQCFRKRKAIICVRKTKFN